MPPHPSLGQCQWSISWTPCCQLVVMVCCCFSIFQCHLTLHKLVGCQGSWYSYLASRAFKIPLRILAVKWLLFSKSIFSTRQRNKPLVNQHSENPTAKQDSWWAAELISRSEGQASPHLGRSWLSSCHWKIEKKKQKQKNWWDSPTTWRD
jgi:hypothetical protein